MSKHMILIIVQNERSLYYWLCVIQCTVYCVGNKEKLNLPQRKMRLSLNVFNKISPQKILVNGDYLILCPRLSTVREIRLT